MTSMTNDNTKESDKVFARLVRMLSARDRSIEEMRCKLKRCDYGEEAVDEAVERAVNCDLLNDERFAHSYCRSKVSAGWGRQRIERELEKLGVDVQRYDGYPDDFFEGADEFERALAELNKYHPRAKNERDARYRHLLSKGYSADVTRRAVADFQRSL